MELYGFVPMRSSGVLIFDLALRVIGNWLYFQI